VSQDPTRPMPADWQTRQPAAHHQYRERRRRRFPLKTVIALVILVLLLAGADQFARVYAQNQIASRVQSSMSLSGKPSVDIEGFPVLTQALISRDLHTIVITGHNLTDGQLDLASINATASNVRIHGTSSATIGSLNGSVTVTLSSVAKAANIPSEIKLSPDGSNMVKATVSVLGFNATGTARVTVSGNDIHVQIVDAAGIPARVLGSDSDFSVPVPKLPSGVSLTGVAVTSAGVQVSFAGTNTTLSQ
jgi:hypothetical protein